MTIDFNSSLIKKCRCHECGQSADLIAEIFDPCMDNKPSKTGFCFNCALLIFDEYNKHKIFKYLCNHN